MKMVRFGTMKKLSETYKKLGIAFTFPIKIKDEKGNRTYCEYIDGYWWRREYDENGKRNGKRTYYENIYGTKKETKRSSCDGKVVEVDGKKYKLTAVKDYEYKAPAWVNWPV